MTVKEQVIAILRSRKFWGLIMGVATAIVSFTYHQIDAQTMVLGVLGVVSAYMIGTGLEGPKQPSTP